MRLLGLALVCLLASGCFAGNTTSGAGPTETTTNKVMELPFQTTADVPAAGTNQVSFEVPAGTIDLTATADWSCTTLCSLSLRLLKPDGQVNYEGSPGSGIQMESHLPTPGTWKFEWSAREGTSVQVDGKLTVVLAIPA